MRLAKAVVIGALASVALACTGGITIPSIPAIPSFPPIVFPSGEGTLPPGVLPSTSDTCAFMSPEEISTAMGATATLTDVSDGDCTFTFSNFSSVNISTEAGTDLQAAHFLFGATAKDTTIAGLPAVTGVFIGQPAVYVQKGANQLQVLGILTGSDDATIAKLVQIATVAVSRWPG
jgi:hypothetical protein